MAILDTSSANTYLADTMTNSKAAADLVTGPLNPVSYIDPVMANISVDQVANLDPPQAVINLVGDNMPPIPQASENPIITALQGALDDPPDIGSVLKYADLSEQISQIMTIVNSMATVSSYIENGIQTLTDGNIPEDIKTKVVGMVLQSVGQNGGTATLGLYSQVSGILLPFVSGHTESALSTALKASKLFGMADEVLSSPVDVNLNIYRDEYDAKMTLLTSGFDKLTTGDGLLKTVDLDPVVASDSPKITSEGTIITSANPPVVQIPPPPPDKQFKGVDGNWEFESELTNQYMTAGGRFVSSVEELECEMSAITRPISEVILHWSETFTNANLTGLELQQLTGAGSNAYHYIIKRDGSMERGVPLDEVGTASPGHNTYSIQICLVGGVNVASEDDAINGNLGASSITRTQFNTLHQLFRVFFLHFPGGQALGHGEFDVTQLDPGFEVRDYVYNAFNKRSLYIDPLNEPEKTPEEIITSIDDPELLITEKNTQSSGLEKF
jgi:hypothetical protein